MGLAFISFHMPKGVGRPILTLVSYFEQFYPLSSGLIEILANVLRLLILESISLREQLGNAMRIIVEKRRDV